MAKRECAIVTAYTGYCMLEGKELGELYRGTDFLNCQCECEVQKDVGIACIHYEECAEESEE